MSGDQIGSIAGSNHSGLSALEYLQRTALDAQVSTDHIKQILKGTKNESQYPKNQLGNSLALISRLIAGGLPSKLKSDCMIPHLQLQINGLVRVCAPRPEKQKAARGRPYCIEIANLLTGPSNCPSW